MPIAWLFRFRGTIHRIKFGGLETCKVWTICVLELVSLAQIYHHLYRLLPILDPFIHFFSFSKVTSPLRLLHLVFTQVLVKGDLFIFNLWKDSHPYRQISCRYLYIFFEPSCFKCELWRLRQLNFNASFIFFKTVSMKAKGNLLSFKLFRDQLQVVFLLLRLEPLTLIIILIHLEFIVLLQQLIILYRK